MKLQVLRSFALLFVDPVAVIRCHGKIFCRIYRQIAKIANSPNYLFLKSASSILFVFILQ